MKPSEMSDEQLTYAVAEEVMGWRDCGEYYSPARNPTQILFTKETTSFSDKWQPLTDARHWMMVAERMASLGFDIRIDWYSDENNELYQAGWGVQFSKPDYEEDVIVKLKGMDAEDMAITLAQLKASQRAKTVQNIIIGRAVLEAALETDRRGQN